MRKPTPSLIIACLALFFSLAGASFAAGRYLITSTSQIKPSVVRNLSKLHVVVAKSSTVTVAPGADGIGIALCRAGYIASGGGATIPGGVGTSLVATSSSPLPSSWRGVSSGWYASMKNTSTMTQAFTVNAICIKGGT